MSRTGSLLAGLVALTLTAYGSAAHASPRSASLTDDGGTIHTNLTDDGGTIHTNLTDDGGTIHTN
ncbi:MAG TPA: hypothetical protein VN730_08735 [Steroidobacteraceae bacterium]|nr:hypothetical protein [Steroidobacteraceae bacterium]